MSKAQEFRESDLSWATSRKTDPRVDPFGVDR